MLSRIVFPPMALQAALLALGAAILARDEWFAPPNHVALPDESWEALPCIVLGLVGFIVFVPLHWLVLWSARLMHISTARLYLVAALVVGLPYFIPTLWASVLAVCVAPGLGFMGLMAWAVDAWCRRQEAAEQCATDRFVLARKQALRRSTSRP